MNVYPHCHVIAVAWRDNNINSYSRTLEIILFCSIYNKVKFFFTTTKMKISMQLGKDVN